MGLPVLPAMANNVKSGVTYDGWTLLAHPSLVAKLEDLITILERTKARHPDRWEQKGIARFLKSLKHKMLVEIPASDDFSQYRHGGKLGKHSRKAAYRNWYRAKPGSRNRLFFRVDIQLKIIIYIWINDLDHPRKEGDKNDP
jgi:hypothetical protein